MVYILFKEKWMRWLTVILLVFEYIHLFGVYNGGKLGGALLAENFYSDDCCWNN